MASAKRRDRYIAVELPDPALGRDLAGAIHEATAGWAREDRPQLLFIEGRRALVRCGHLAQSNVVRMLNTLRLRGAQGQVRTVGASGTIRRARMRYFAHRGETRA